MSLHIKNGSLYVTRLNAAQSNLFFAIFSKTSRSCCGTGSLSNRQDISQQAFVAIKYSGQFTGFYFTD